MGEKIKIYVFIIYFKCNTKEENNIYFDNKQQQKFYSLNDNELKKEINNQNSFEKTFSQAKTKFLGSLIRSKTNGDNEYFKDGGTFRQRKDTINPCDDPEIVKIFKFSFKN